MLKLDRNTKNVIKFSIAVIAVGYILYFTTLSEYAIWQLIVLFIAVVSLVRYAWHVFNDK
jgi:hypothetical protein